ncbi:MAG: peptidase S8 [Deltaproteobacteria bacterium]|nr:peptidase S8 [Deltaproteobacteria bacterium]
MMRLCIGLMALAWALLSPSIARAQDQPSTPDDIPGELAVDLLDGLSEADIDAFKTSLGFPARPSSFLSARTHIFRVTLPAAQQDALIARLRGDVRIENLEPVALVHASWTPNDPMLDKQWHLSRVGAERAWAWSVGRGVTVAVIDTGVACEDHPPFSRGSDLADTWCVTGHNFIDGSAHAADDQGHGTHVAGTIAQSTNNGIGAAGLAFKARIMPIKVLDSTGTGTTVDVADGIRFAADLGAHVINMSLGSSRASKLMREAIAYARSRGVVIVAAAGNNGRFVEYPAAFDGVIAVSATDSSDKLARFSSRGPEVDIAAPGVAVLQQTICNGGLNKCERYPELSGTSMASPHVAAAAALLVSVGLNNPTSVERALYGTARSIDGQGRGSPLYGAGLLDAGKAVSNVVLTHAAVRLALVAILTALVVWRIRKKGGIARPSRLGFVLSALAFGPGLLFLAPLVAPRVILPIDILARPVGEWDMILGASVHRWLPLAHFLIPVALSAVGFGIAKLRPVIAGVSLGTAAYLVSQPLLGILATTNRGLLILWVWALVNVAICLWVARLTMDEKPS